MHFPYKKFIYLIGLVIFSIAQFIKPGMESGIIPNNYIYSSSGMAFLYPKQIALVHHHQSFTRKNPMNHHGLNHKKLHLTNHSAEHQRIHLDHNHLDRKEQDLIKLADKHNVRELEIIHEGENSSNLKSSKKGGFGFNPTNTFGIGLSANADNERGGKDGRKYTYRLKMNEKSTVDSTSSNKKNEIDKKYDVIYKAINTGVKGAVTYKAIDVLNSKINSNEQEINKTNLCQSAEEDKKVYKNKNYDICSKNSVLQ